MFGEDSSMKFGCRGDVDAIGVLIAQLGTPDEPTPGALRRYLREFLGDKRVIEVNRFLWWIILNFIILPTRPKRSAALYKRVWTEKGSPLLLTTDELTQGLAKNLAESPVHVAFGMRYGSPSLTTAIDELVSKGCRRILLVPMYPQYSGATTGSTYDMVFQHLLTKRWVPTLRVLEPYYRRREFIDSVAHRVNETLRDLSWEPERLIISYHGIPEKYVHKGDPYCCHCSETTAALIPHIEFPQERIIQTFQSRFGRDPWLQPYADETIERLGKEGIKRIAVVCPAFTVDCLETIDEMGHEALETFVEHGGEKLKLIPCVNAHPVWIENLSQMIKNEIGDWLVQADNESCVKYCPNETFKEKKNLDQQDVFQIIPRRRKVGGGSA
jgi:protoporphyrin/coproporphyrin ferrochelatase